MPQEPSSRPQQQHWINFLDPWVHDLYPVPSEQKFLPDGFFVLDKQLKSGNALPDQKNCRPVMLVFQVVTGID